MVTAHFSPNYMYMYFALFFQQRVESVTLLVGRDEDSLKEVDQVSRQLMTKCRKKGTKDIFLIQPLFFFVLIQATLLMLHSGWRTLMAPEGTVCSVVRVEVKGLQNNVRVRQLLVHGVPARTLDSTLPAVMAQQKACEGEALRVFRLLTSQVFDCVSVSVHVC